MQLDKKLLKRYFTDHTHNDLPDFADKVHVHLTSKMSHILSSSFYGLFYVFWCYIGFSRLMLIKCLVAGGL